MDSQSPITAIGVIVGILWLGTVGMTVVVRRRDATIESASLRARDAFRDALETEYRMSSGSDLEQFANALEKMIRSEPSDKTQHAAWVESSLFVQDLLNDLWQKHPLPAFLWEYFTTHDLHLEVPSTRDNECMELVIAGLRSGKIPTDKELNESHKTRDHCDRKRPDNSRQP